MNTLIDSIKIDRVAEKAGKGLEKILKKGYQGSLTVEAAYLMTILGMVLAASIIILFYFHDKNIISSCAYETAVVGSTKAREKEGVDSDILVQAFRERIHGKCILFPDADVEVQVGEKQIVVFAYSQRKGMSVSVKHTMKVTDPEKYIRDLRKIAV